MADLNSIITLTSGLKASDLSTIGVTGASLGITPASLGVVDAESRLFKEVTDGSRRPYGIPTINSVINRANSWSYTWSNSESWTNYYNYLTGDQNRDCERAFWMSLGTNNRQNTINYSNQDMYQGIGHLIWTKNSVNGGEGVHIAVGNNTSYAPIRFKTMFLRNHHPTLSKTVTMYGHYSNYWSSGYDGSGVCIGTPNVNGSYNNVTSITWSVPVNRTGGNSNYTWSWNVTIPPKTTVSVTQANSMYYWQSGYVYWWLDNGKFYDLHTTFSDFWVQPDLKMTQAAYLYNDQNNEFNVFNSYRIWNRTGELFGDR